MRTVGRLAHYQRFVFRYEIVCLLPSVSGGSQHDMPAGPAMVTL
jgi:hypothetical protein